MIKETHKGCMLHHSTLPILMQLLLPSCCHYYLSKCTSVHLHVYALKVFFKKIAGKAFEQQAALNCSRSRVPKTSGFQTVLESLSSCKSSCWRSSTCIAMVMPVPEKISSEKTYLGALWPSRGCRVPLAPSANFPVLQNCSNCAPLPVFGPKSGSGSWLHFGTGLRHGETGRGGHWLFFLLSAPAQLQKHQNWHHSIP